MSLTSTVVGPLYHAYHLFNGDISHSTQYPFFLVSYWVPSHTQPGWTESQPHGSCPLQTHTGVGEG